MPPMAIDANYAANPALGDGLERSTDNLAVLREMFYIEAYRRGSVDGAARSFDQLARRPRQVLALSDTATLFDLPARERGAASRLQCPHVQSLRLPRRGRHRAPMAVKGRRVFPDGDDWKTTDRVPPRRLRARVAARLCQLRRPACWLATRA